MLKRRENNIRKFEGLQRVCTPKLIRRGQCTTCRPRTGQKAQKKVLHDACYYSGCHATFLCNYTSEHPWPQKAHAPCYPCEHLSKSARTLQTHNMLPHHFQTHRHLSCKCIKQSNWRGSKYLSVAVQCIGAAQHGLKQRLSKHYKKEYTTGFREADVAYTKSSTLTLTVHAAGVKWTKLRGYTCNVTFVTLSVNNCCGTHPH